MQMLASFLARSKGAWTGVCRAGDYLGLVAVSRGSGLHLEAWQLSTSSVLPQARNPESKTSSWGILQEWLADVGINTVFIASSHLLLLLEMLEVKVTEDPHPGASQDRDRVR